MSEGHQYQSVRWVMIGFTAAIVTLCAWLLLRATPLVFAHNQPLSPCGCTGGTIVPLGLRLFALGLTALSVTALITLALKLFLVLRQQFCLEQKIQRLIVRRVHHHPTGKTYCVVNQSLPQAYSLGFLRPRIFLTTGLIRHLSKSEITAVVTHEAAHCRSYDPLVAALLDGIDRAWGSMMPWIRSWSTAAMSLRELAADADATANYHHPEALAGAVVKLAESNPLALAAMSPNASRVEKLLDHSWRPRWRLWRWQYVGGALGLIVGCFLLGHIQTAVAKSNDLTPHQCHDVQVMCHQAAQLRMEEWVCANDPGQCFNLRPSWMSLDVINISLQR